MLVCQASVILPAGTTAAAAARCTTGPAASPAAAKTAVSSTLRRVGLTVAIAVSSCSAGSFLLQSLAPIVEQLCNRVFRIVCDLVGADLYSSERPGRLSRLTASA